MEMLTKFFIELYSLTSEMAPYLILGFFFAGILHVFVKKENISKYLGAKNIKSIVYATLIGIPLPLCSCGVIPTGVSFYKDGASKGATVSFLISTPQTGIDSIMATYSLIGLPFAILRPIIALLTGIFGGYLTNKITHKNIESFNQPLQKKKIKTNQNKIKSLFNYAFVELVQDISKWLIIGLVIAAIISILIPDNFFNQYVGNKFISMLIVLLASIPFYVCATGSIPIAAVLLMKGISPGAALVFLMAGPATNTATISVIGSSLGRKTLFTYLVSIIVGALFFGILIDYILPFNFINLSILSNCHNHSNLNLINHLSFFILVGSILFATTKKYLLKNNSIHKNNSIEIKVLGMKCNHCKANVEKRINEIKNVEKVIALPQENRVIIQGTNIKIEQIIQTIKNLGYKIG